MRPHKIYTGFVCPKCKNKTDIEAVSDGVIITEHIEHVSANGHVEYLYEDEDQRVHSKHGTRFQCRHCGWNIPVEHEDELAEWCNSLGEYNLLVEWKQSALVNYNARSLQDAVLAAQNDELPDGSYDVDSFDVVGHTIVRPGKGDVIDD